MKQRKCPYGKDTFCFDYGCCEECVFGLVIDKYERKIKRLKAKIKKLKKAQENGGSEK